MVKKYLLLLVLICSMNVWCGEENNQNKYLLTMPAKLCTSKRRFVRLTIKGKDWDLDENNTLFIMSKNLFDIIQEEVGERITSIQFEDQDTINIEENIPIYFHKLANTGIIHLMLISLKAKEIHS